MALFVNHLDQSYKDIHVFFCPLESAIAGLGWEGGDGACGLYQW